MAIYFVSLFMCAVPIVLLIAESAYREKCRLEQSLTNGDKCY